MLTLCALVLIARASSFSPDTLILAGMTLSAAFEAVSVIAVSSGDPRVIILYNLLAGSTWNDVSRTSGGAYAPGADGAWRCNIAIMQARPAIHSRTAARVARVFRLRKAWTTKPSEIEPLSVSRSP